jgi:nucleoside-diphosphate-sugar epimerase
VADALDPDAVARAVAEAEPEVIVHQLTALSGPFDLRHLDRTLAATNRLRTEGTDNLLAAGRAVGARRVVAQSYAGWQFARVGGPVKTEADPLDPAPPEPLRATVGAIRYLERVVTGITWGEGLVLRYGPFYGPGTSLSADPSAEMSEVVRRHKLPVLGDGGGVWSFIHIEDAAAATVAAIERGAPGIYQVVDDDPAPVRAWLPELAQVMHAKPPRRIPRWLGRLLAGEVATIAMTELRGASNAKAKRELGWQPRYASWRAGFAEGLS